MDASKTSGRLPDSFEVQVLPEGLHISAVERRDNARSPNVILVRFRARRTARVKRERNFFDSRDSYFWGSNALTPLCRASVSIVLSV